MHWSLFWMFLVVTLIDVSICIENTGIVIELNDANFDEIVSDPTKNVLVEFFANWCGHCQDFVQTYEEIAADLRDEPDVLVAKLDGAQYNHLVHRFGIRAYPTFAVFAKNDKSGNRKYQGNRIKQAIIQFVLSGGKSQDEDSDDEDVGIEESAVVVLSKRTFDSVVFDMEKDVLVAFTTPWCSHCRLLAPIYEEVALMVKTKEGGDKVVIAKIDAGKYQSVANRFDASSYPTIILFPRSDKSGSLIFHGTRNKDQLVQFALSRASNGEGNEADDEESEEDEEEEESDALTLTRKTFDQTVLDPKKDVLVLFYSNDCSHCSDLNPTYDEVARKFKIYEDVLITRINGAKAESVMHKYGISAFPTLALFSKTDKSGGLRFQGSRSKDRLVKYVLARGVMQDEGSAGEEEGFCQWTA